DEHGAAEGSLVVHEREKSVEGTSDQWDTVVRSSARFSSITLTRGSPSRPNWRPVVFASIRRCTTAGARPRSRATGGAWYCAAATLISGSRPLAEAVTRSTGIGALFCGSAWRSASMRPLTASMSAGFVAAWFEPPELAPLYAIGLVAEGRPQKCFGS